MYPAIPAGAPPPGDDPTTLPVILFGAFDRHNFGDLLFPHVAAAMLPDRELQFAGLADRDLRPFGGHLVRPLARLVEELGDRRAALMHVGGEVLTCDAWQAAVMLLPPEQVQSTIARLDRCPAERLAWAQGCLRDATGDGQALAPYVASLGRFPALARVVHAGVGGVALDECTPALRAEVLSKLATADAVTVRDRWTRARLEAAGVAARLIPDPAVMVAGLFAARVRERSFGGEPARAIAAFPQGYLAVQFGADFGDDDTLDRIAAQLERVAAATGLGIVLFRAGAAPWHDDIEVLRRTAARIRSSPSIVFESLDLWDICALIAHARGYCGSSLHGRIVAMAFGLPRVNLARAADAADTAEACAGDRLDITDRCGKQQAFAATWDLPELPAVVDVDRIASGVRDALAADPERLRRLAGRLVEAYRDGFGSILRGLA